MSEIVQFDTAKTIIGGSNIVEASQSNSKLVYNESYTVVGNILKASSVYACYDLTVIGCVEVDEIEVKGNLYVVGNIKSKMISCLKSIVCTGDIDARLIYGDDIIANDITCDEIYCNGNIIAETTIDISKCLEAEKAVIAGEGIIGNGHFTTSNAVAGEYFDFSGEVLGKVLELETDHSFGKEREYKEGKEGVYKRESIADASVKLRDIIIKELKRAGEIDEDQLAELVKQLSSIDKEMLSDWNMLTNKIIEISYLNSLTNLRDYLIVVMAKKILPKEIINYETIEHVFNGLLIKAEDEIGNLTYHASDIEELAYSLRIVSLCENELKMDKDEILDQIFQSIGIKFKTVQSFLD